MKIISCDKLGMSEIQPKVRGRPRKMPIGDDSQWLHVVVSREVADWLDEEWHRRRLPSRADTIRALFEELKDGDCVDAA